MRKIEKKKGKLY